MHTHPCRHKSTHIVDKQIMLIIEAYPLYQKIKSFLRRRRKRRRERGRKGKRVREPSFGHTYPDMYVEESDNNLTGVDSAVCPGHGI